MAFIIVNVILLAWLGGSDCRNRMMRRQRPCYVQYTIRRPSWNTFSVQSKVIHHNLQNRNAFVNKYQASVQVLLDGHRAACVSEPGCAVIRYSRRRGLNCWNSVASRAFVRLGSNFPHRCCAIGSAYTLRLHDSYCSANIAQQTLSQLVCAPSRS